VIATRVRQTAYAAGVAAGRIWGSGENDLVGLGEATPLTTAYALEPTESVIERPAAVAAGGAHSLALDASGSVWAWGRNDHGQLGLVAGTLEPEAAAQRPYRVDKLADVIAIAAGTNHSLALRADGAVWAWGDNERGQLGDGTMTDRSLPVRAKGLGPVVAIAAGLDFSLALDLDGKVWGWGANDHGQLGDGTIQDRLLAVAVSAKLDEVVAISACGGGGEHSLALRANGTVWGWGFNGHGQLGDGTTSDRRSPKPCSVKGAIGIGAGAWHSLVLLSDGAVIAAGANESGQLGDGTTSDRHTFDFVTVAEGDDPDPYIPLTEVVEVAAGGWHNLARIVDGSVRAWGAGNGGRMGTGTEADHHDAVFVVEASDVDDDPAYVGAPAADMCAIAAGAMHSLMIRTIETGSADSGTVTSMPWAWGEGGGGQIIGNTSPGYAPYALTFAPPAPYIDLPGTGIAAETQHSLATYGGEIYVWGPTSTGSGFTSDPGLVTAALPTFPADAVTVAARGEIAALALTASGALWSWQLVGAAAGQIPVVDDQGLGQDCTAIAVGYQHWLALTSDGRVWAWGRNNRGQLGNGTAGPDWQNVPGRVVSLAGVVAVAAGADHSLALRADGHVWAWGANGEGQLGNNSTADAASPVLVRRSNGDLIRVKAIAAGAEHSLGLDAAGRVWGWGSNAYLQLGINYAQSKTARPVTWSADRPRAPALKRVKAVAAGHGHSLALLADGRVFAWGLNNSGQLGDGTTDTRGPSSTKPVTWAYEVDPESGLEQILPIEGITAIAAGEYHNLALGGQPASPSHDG
jgi:alpha-tubulin suppressor-like RCC1 family protein